MRANEHFLDPDSATAPLVAIRARHKPGAGPVHTHRRAQLVQAPRGVMAVSTEQGLWVVPPSRGVWVPAGQPHRVSSAHGYELVTLYCDSTILSSKVTLADCVVVEVPALAAAMLQTLSEAGLHYPADGRYARLAATLLDWLPIDPIAALTLRMPTDRRARNVAEAIVAAPADVSNLNDLAQRAGITVRTMSRLFCRETGLSPSRWRQQARMLASLDALARGDSVTTAALDVGYADPSAFIGVFKATFGVTPAAYFGR